MKNRLANIELLRIISMMLIVATHIFGHCIDMEGSVYPFPPGYIFYWMVKSATYIAVNMYVVIGAYFLCQSKFSTKRILSLWIECIFYSILIGVIACFKGYVSSPKDLLFVFCPLTSNEYWFATVYLGLLLLSPFINMFLNTASQKTHMLLCTVCILLFSVVPQMIWPISPWMNFGGGVGLLWFVTLYIIAAYIRKYINLDKYRLGGGINSWRFGKCDARFTTVSHCLGDSKNLGTSCSRRFILW